MMHRKFFVFLCLDILLIILYFLMFRYCLLPCPTIYVSQRFHAGVLSRQKIYERLRYTQQTYQNCWRCQNVCQGKNKPLFHRIWYLKFYLLST